MTFEEELKEKIEENDKAWNEELENGNNDKLLETLTIKAKVLKECLELYEQSVDYKAREIIIDKDIEIREIKRGYANVETYNLWNTNNKLTQEEWDILQEWLKGKDNG